MTLLADASCAAPGSAITLVFGLELSNDGVDYDDWSAPSFSKAVLLIEALMRAGQPLVARTPTNNLASYATSTFFDSITIYRMIPGQLQAGTSSQTQSNARYVRPVRQFSEPTS